MPEQFTPKLIDNFDEVNQQNIETFKKHKIKNPEEIRHKCVLCGRDVSIMNSVSSQGARLVCNECYRNNGGFEDDSMIEKWVWPDE